MNKFIVLDLESGPLPAERLAEIKPTFEPDARLRDAEKIAASIAEKEAQWNEGHALRAERGRILAVGLWPSRDSEPTSIIGDNSEDLILKDTWQWIGDALSGTTLVGHNIWGFDLPFMVRRSWALKVAVPEFVTRALNKRYCPDWCHDCMLAWSQRPDERISLDLLAWHCGVGRKLDGMTGADFARVYAEDREKALSYLRQDLSLVKAIYLRQTGQETP